MESLLVEMVVKTYLSVACVSWVIGFEFDTMNEADDLSDMIGFFFLWCALGLMWPILQIVWNVPKIEVSVRGRLR